MSSIIGILAMASFIWIVYDILSNERSMPVNNKVIWIIVGAFFNIATAIVYYFAVKRKLF